MNSSSIWKSVSQWDSGIRYTVNHPVGKVYIFDKNRGENTCIYRETPLKKFRGKKSGEGVEFFMIKKRKIPIDFSRESCHSSNYTGLGRGVKGIPEIIREKEIRGSDIHGFHGQGIQGPWLYDSILRGKTYGHLVPEF